MARIVPSRYTIAIVLFVVIIFVILTIAAIRLFGHAAPTLQRYPPWISECPPYWTNEGNGRCSYNPAQPNGKASCNQELQRLSSRISGLAYAGNSAVNFKSVPLPDRCQWSKQCQVYWEGVSDQNCSNTEHFNKYSLGG